MTRRGFYTSRPKLNSTYVKGCFQFLFWHVFHVLAWKNFIQTIDESENAFFCFALFRKVYLRKSQFRRLVLSFCMIFVALGLVILLLLEIRIDVDWRNVVGILLGIMIGLIMATLITVPSGLFAGAVSILALPIIFGGRDTLLIDVLGDYRLALFVGCLGGVCSFAVINLGNIDLKEELVKQIGGTVLGLVSTCIVGGFLFGQFGLATIFWQRGMIGEHTVTFIILSIITFFFGLLIWMRTSRVPSLRMVVFLVGVIGFITILTTFDGSAGYGTHMAGKNLLVSATMLVIVSFLILYVLSFTVTYRIAGPFPAALTALIASQLIHPLIGLTFYVYDWPLQLFISSAIACLIFTAPWWRPLLFFPLQSAWHTILFQADESRDSSMVPYFHLHAAFWDDLQKSPWPSLDQHVMLVLEKWPSEGKKALAYLAQGPQRWAAVSAQVEMDARLLAEISDIDGLATVHRRLGSNRFDESDSSLVSSFAYLSQDIQVALEQTSTYNQRLALLNVGERLDDLNNALMRSAKPQAARFQLVVHRWQQLIADYIATLAEMVELRQEIANPYVIGVPLTAQQSIFVGRGDISARIESLLLGRQQAPLLLYGQRRMGKTSLLNNLGRLLPSHLLPLFVDLQGPISFARSHSSLFYNVARSMVHSAEILKKLSLPSPQKAHFEEDPFTAFNEWLDEIISELVGKDIETILLMLDEFEALDSALRRGRFDENAILGTLRHIFQHKPHIKILLSGSHTLQEFERWSSYFINAQVIHISYLKREEALQLIEKPIKGFSLRYHRDAREYVLKLTRQHPFLLQLLCNEIVILKNKQPIEYRRLATVDDVASALESALDVGHLFFTDIARNQITPLGNRVLQAIAVDGANGPVPVSSLPETTPNKAELLATINLLKRRELIAETPAGFEFQIELVRQWFLKRGKMGESLA